MSEPLKIIQITDTHLFPEKDGKLLGVATYESFHAVLSSVKTEYPNYDYVLMTGDLVQGQAVESYKKLQEGVLGLGKPVYCLMGNHDDRDIFKQAITSPEIHFVHTLDVDPWAFVFVDSQVLGSEGGAVTEAELQKLDGALSSLVNRHVMVCLHHQPVPVGSRWLDTMQVKNSEAFLNILERHQHVKAVIWGHVHQAFSGQHEGIQLYSCPSTCIQFKPNQEDFALDTEVNPGFRWFELHADGSIVSEVVRLKDFNASLDLEAGGY